MNTYNYLMCKIKKQVMQSYYTFVCESHMLRGVLRFCVT